LNPATVTVLELLLEAFEQKRELDGWQLMRALHRSGPSIYAVLDRLESAGWIEGEFEPQRQKAGKPQPRRRFYRLTGIGVEAARAQSAKAAARRPVLRPRLGLYLLPGGPA
jgi:DNA-binding PadR family transcriptional regulator